MVAPALVLVDTCMWVSFFSRHASAGKKTVTELILANRAVLIGSILAEILRGFRRETEADWANASLKGVRFTEMNRDDWRATGRLGRDVASRGHQLPLADLAVAAISFRYGYAVYSSDPHFDLIPKLMRYRIE